MIPNARGKLKDAIAGGALTDNEKDLAILAMSVIDEAEEAIRRVTELRIEVKRKDGQIEHLNTQILGLNGKISQQKKELVKQLNFIKKLKEQGEAES